MKDSYWILIWAVVIGGTFALLWRGGHLARFAAYVQQTKEELRKCTWPTFDELKGSTVVVAIATVLLGGFTVVVDFVTTILVRWLT